MRILKAIVKAAWNFILSLLLALFEFPLFVILFILSLLFAGGLAIIATLSRQKRQKVYFLRSSRKIWRRSFEFLRFAVGGFIYCVPPLRRRFFHLLPKTMQDCIDRDSEHHNVVNHDIPKWALQPQGEKPRKSRDADADPDKERR